MSKPHGDPPNFKTSPKIKIKGSFWKRKKIEGVE